MPVGFVIFAFFVGGVLGAFAMALVNATHDRNELLGSMREDGLGAQLPTGETSKWN